MEIPAARACQARRRGSTDAQSLLSLIYTLAAGGGHLNAVDALAADEAACVGAGLAGAVPNSRRLGEFLTHFSDSALDGLRDCVRSVSKRVVPVVAKACYREQGYVPVFIDGTGIDGTGIDGTSIDGTGKHREKAAVGYNGDRQYWLHAVFVGLAWASARLHAGLTDVKGHFAAQLVADVDPLPLGCLPVWTRRAAARSSWRPAKRAAGITR